MPEAPRSLGEGEASYQMATLPISGKPIASRSIIGRTHESAIAIDSPQVSRQHAAIELSDGQIWVEDLGSTHGTRARDAVVEVGRRVAVAAGDVIELGSVIALLQHLPAVARNERARRDDAAATAGPIIVDSVV